MAKKTQAELDLIAEQHRNSTAALEAMGGYRRKTFASPAVSPTSPSGVDFSDVMAPDATASGRQRIIALTPEAAPKDREWYNLWEFAKDTVGSETLLSGAMVASYEAGFAADLKWTLPDEGSKEFKALTEGLDPKHWSVFEKAVSAEHANYLRFKVNEELDRQQRMMEYGGVTGVIAANVLNPENFLLGMASGGLAWANRGRRLARALKTAGLTAAENVAVEGALQQMQETRDEWDIATGALAGVILGGTFGALGRGIDGPVPKRLHDAPQRDMLKLSQHEAVARGLLDEAHLKASELRKVEAEFRSAAVKDRVADLRGTADGAPSRTELNNLRQTYENAKLSTSRAEAQLSVIEQRMFADDVKSMGEKAAKSKQYTKLRKAAAKLEHDKLAGDTRSREGSLKKQLEQAERKATARAEADRLEVEGPKATTDVRRMAEWLRGDNAKVLPAKLEKARNDLAKALKLTRRPAQEVAETFGRDSASAARVGDEFDTSVRDLVPSSGALEPQAEFAPTARTFEPLRLIGAAGMVERTFGKRWALPLPRFDMANVLRGVDSEVARGTAGMYVGDPIGASKGLNPIGASEAAGRLFDTMKSKFHRSYEPSFDEWLKEAKGLDALKVVAGRNTRAYRKEFGDAVDRALRFPNGEHGAAARKAAAKLQELYMGFGKRAHDAGIKGFEHWKPDGTYAPRVFDWIRAHALDEHYGTENMEKFVVEAVKSGMRKAGVPMEEGMEKLANLIGKGYFNTIRTKAAGITPSAFNGVRLGDLDQIAAILDVSGVDALAKSEALQRLGNVLKPREKEAGAIRYSKSRTLLDEEFSAKLWNGTEGVFEEKSFRDLFMEHDAEQLFETYARSMSGHIGLAEQAGVRSAKDHTDLMAKMADVIPNRKERDHVVKTMDRAYKLITGSPLGDPNEWRPARRLGRAMRDYNFVRVMNQVGFAQIPDSAAFLTPQYFRYAKQFLPEVHRFMRQAADGTLDHRLAREVEELIATGTDFDNVNLFSRYEDEAAAKASKLESGLQAGEHAMRVAGRFTSTFSGLRTLTDFNQRLAGMSAMNRIVANIAGRAKDMDTERMLNLGLTPEKIARIKAQVDQHVKFEGKHKLLTIGTGDWDDARALNDLGDAVYREARRLVQEEDVGDTHAFMHTGIGKILFQFRRFPLVAYSKQLGHGLVHGDVETLTRTGMQIGLGSMSYAAQMYLYSLTKPESEREEWRKKNLTAEKIFYGGIFRAGMFSLLPQAATALREYATGESSEGYRTTGLSSGLQGIPAVDLTFRTLEAGSDIIASASRSDLQYDQDDFDNLRRTLPFQNAFVIKQLLDHMQQMLPEKDRDEADEFGYSIDED